MHTRWCLVAQSCLTLCDSMDCSPLGSSIHGILQARTLELVAFPFSGGSFQPRDWTHISCITSRFFVVWGTREFLLFSGIHGMSSWILDNKFEFSRYYLHGLQLLHGKERKEKGNSSRSCVCCLSLIKMSSVFNIKLDIEALPSRRWKEDCLHTL